MVALICYVKLTKPKEVINFTFNNFRPLIQTYYSEVEACCQVAPNRAESEMLCWSHNQYLAGKLV